MRKEILTLRKHIKQNGLKGTAQREKILEHLLEAKAHLSPEAVFESLRRKDSTLGRATVFRTLKLLEGCGLVSKVTFADGRHKYEAVRGRPHHDHMICTDCGDALEFSSPVVEREQERIAKDFGFTISWHQHELFGRCRKCARRSGQRKN